MTILDPELAQAAACAYLAGIVDGEGYVGIKRRNPTAANKMVSYRYTAAVAVAMTDRGPVEFMAKFCGAGYPLIKGRRPYKIAYICEFESRQAVEFLRQILPYLIAKKRTAELAIQLYELQRNSRLFRTKVVSVHTFKGGRSIGRPYQIKGLSDEYVQRLEDLYQASVAGASRGRQPSFFK